MWNAVRRLFGGGKKGCDHQNLTPDEENRLAEEIRTSGDLPHAAFHAANAVSHDVHNAEYLATLDRILDIAPDPLALFAPDENGGMAFPQGAARAYVLHHRLKRTDEALGVLYSVVLARPDLPYLDWAVAWVKDATTSDPTTHFLAQLMQAADANELDRSHARPTLERVPTLVDAVLKAGRTGEDGVFYTAAGGLLRRIGYPQKAIEVAQTAYETAPSYWSAVALGSALRESDPKAAIAAFEKATQHDESDLAVWLDIGDLRTNLGDREGAKAAYAHVCEREPEHPWAYPSLLALTWDETRADSDQKKLTDFAKRAKDKSRVLHLCWQRFRLYTGSLLPTPGEAIVNLGAQLVEKVGQEKLSALKEASISRPESPSAIASVGRALQRLGIASDFHATFAEVPRPSPLEPRRPVALSLWRFEEHRAYPALPAPPEPIAETVAALARTNFGFVSWYIDAKNAVLTKADGAALAASMTFPLPPEGAMADWDWTQRTTLAGAYLLAAHDPDTLFEILAGPMDWSVWAAALALSARAQDDEALEMRLLPELQETIQHWERVAIPEFMHPLHAALAALPSLDEKTRKATERTIARLQSSG